MMTCVMRRMLALWLIGWGAFGLMPKDQIRIIDVNVKKIKVEATTGAMFTKTIIMRRLL